LPPLAMINVDFASPSLVLGITLIGCGIALLQVRNSQHAYAAAVVGAVQGAMHSAACIHSVRVL
jgi:hypothetical protein